MSQRACIISYWGSFPYIYNQNHVAGERYMAAFGIHWVGSFEAKMHDMIEAFQEHVSIHFPGNGWQGI